jgi:hypothetical protein
VKEFPIPELAVEEWAVGTWGDRLEAAGDAGRGG